MIYYTIEVDISIEIGQVVQKNTDNVITINDGTGYVLGIAMSCESIADTSKYELMIYASGGGGVKMRLGADWDGLPSRFDFQNDSVVPTSEQGVGWLIPEYPLVTKARGDLVHGAIYK